MRLYFKLRKCKKFTIGVKKKHFEVHVEYLKVSVDSSIAQFHRKIKIYLMHDAKKKSFSRLA